MQSTDKQPIASRPRHHRKLHDNGRTNTATGCIYKWATRSTKPVDRIHRVLCRNGCNHEPCARHKMRHNRSTRASTDRCRSTETSPRIQRRPITQRAGIEDPRQPSGSQFVNTLADAKDLRKRALCFDIHTLQCRGSQHKSKHSISNSEDRYQLDHQQAICTTTAPRHEATDRFKVQEARRKAALKCSPRLTNTQRRP